MSEIETPWCPCQERVDGVDRLERVKSHHYYEQKRKRVGPETPQTRRGIKIIEENFPVVSRSTSSPVRKA